MMSKGMKSKVTKIDGVGHRLYEFPVIAGGGYTASGTGVLSYGFGFLELQSSVGFGPLALLFDLFRVKRLHFHCDPKGAGQVPAPGSTPSGVHVPFIIKYEPDALVNQLFSTLFVRNLLTDKMVRRSDTSKTIDHSVAVPATVLASDSGVPGRLLTTLGNWNTTGNLTQDIAGRLLWASATDTQNFGVSVGSYVVQADVEFAFRV